MLVPKQLRNKWCSSDEDGRQRRNTKTLTKQSTYFNSDLKLILYIVRSVNWTRGSRNLTSGGPIISTWETRSQTPGNLATDANLSSIPNPTKIFQFLQLEKLA